MALTNFAALTDEELTIWSFDLWQAARNASYVDGLAGESGGSCIHRVSELTQDRKGARAVLTLVHDLEGDGQVGDAELEGREEELKSSDEVITLDQMRHGNQHQGKMSEQRSVITFRTQSKDKLAYWLGDRRDQLALLTLSGRSYALHNNGVPRVGSAFPDLRFAADITAPSPNRFAAQTTTGLVTSGVTDSQANLDFISWAGLMDFKAHLKETYMRPARDENSNGQEVFHVFVTPTVGAKLKQDPDYLAAARNARERASSNPLFTGQYLDIDGLVIHEHRHVFNADTSIFSGATNRACQVLFLGAQALGLADIGEPEWEEEYFDYKNRLGIAIGKICGMLKPQFYSIYTKQNEDFGVGSMLVRQS